MALYEDPTRLSAWSCTWVTTTPWDAPRLGHSGWNVPSGKGPEGAGQMVQLNGTGAPKWARRTVVAGLHQHQCGQRPRAVTIPLHWALLRHLRSWGRASPACAPWLLQQGALHKERLPRKDEALFNHTTTNPNYHLQRQAQSHKMSFDPRTPSKMK